MNNEIRSQINFRVDPKLRYLLGIAAQARNMSFTEYIEAALWDSFKNVSIDEYPEMSEEALTSELSKDEIIELANKRKDAPVEIERSLHKAAEALWDERPFTRLAMLSTLAPHLMDDVDRAVWEHIHSNKAFKTGGKLDRKRINEQWEQIRAYVFNRLVTNAKGKAKGND